MKTYPVRIPCESFLDIRLAIANWFVDHSQTPNWDYYPYQPCIVFYFENEDARYEFLAEFEA